MCGGWDAPDGAGFFCCGLLVYCCAARGHAGDRPPSVRDASLPSLTITRSCIIANPCRTDGDELGDGCCAWPNYTPQTTSDISNPSFPTSVTGRAGCSSVAPPAPSSVTVTSCGAGCAKVAFPKPALTSACVCETKLSISVNGASAQVYGAINSHFQLCGLAYGATVSAQVFFLNRAGTSAATTGAGSAGVPLDGPVAAGTCSALNPSPFYMDTAGTKRMEAERNALLPGLWLVVVGALFAACAAAVHAIKDPHSTCRRAFVHKHAYTPVPTSDKRTGNNASVFSRLTLKFLDFFGISDLLESGIGYTLAFCAVGFALAGCAYSTYTYYDWMMFPLGNKAAAARGIGYALAASMGFQLLPASRYSIFLPLFGISFERSLRLHRWAGMFTVLFAFLHALIIIINFADSKLGWEYCFSWSATDAVNPLAGFLAGLCILILTILSWNPIRRKFYELFLFGHMLWPVAYIFAFLHIQKSDSNLVPFFVPPLALTCLDFALLALDMFFLRGSVLVDAGVIMGDGNVLGCAAPTGTPAPASQAAGNKAPVAAYLLIDKLPGTCGWPFVHEAGQYVYITLPKISLFPHPVSISSVADPRYPGRFTLHIKSMGPATWSQRVIDAVSNAVDACATQQLNNSSITGSGIRRSSTPDQRYTVNAEAVDWPVASSTAAAMPTAASQASDAELSRWPTSSVAAMRKLIPVHIAGPFGAPSLQLDKYKHFVLFAGGIGITPIAPLHYTLSRGLPITKYASAIGTLLCGSKASHAQADVSTVTTVWSMRDTSLTTAFAPLLPTGHVLKGSGSVGGGAAAGIADVIIFNTSLKSQSASPPAASAGVELTRVTPVKPAPTQDAVQTPYGSDFNGEPTEPGTPYTLAAGGRVTAVVPVGGAPGAVATPSAAWQVRPGRPDIYRLLQQAGTAAAERELLLASGSTNGAINREVCVAIVVCGPADMVRSVIAAAADLDGTAPVIAGITAMDAAGTGSQANGMRLRYHVHRETFLL